ncbi:unnamed protein product, partial [Protopolystoma xenopodis]
VEHRRVCSPHTATGTEVHTSTAQRGDSVIRAFTASPHARTDGNNFGQHEDRPIRRWSVGSSPPTRLEASSRGGSLTCATGRPVNCPQLLILVLSHFSPARALSSLSYSFSLTSLILLLLSYLSLARSISLCLWIFISGPIPHPLLLHRFFRPLCSVFLRMNCLILGLVISPSTPSPSPTSDRLIPFGFPMTATTPVARPVPMLGRRAAGRLPVCCPAIDLPRQRVIDVSMSGGAEFPWSAWSAWSARHALFASVLFCTGWSGVVETSPPKLPLFVEVVGVGLDCHLFSFSTTRRGATASRPIRQPVLSFLFSSLLFSQPLLHCLPSPLCSPPRVTQRFANLLLTDSDEAGVLNRWLDGVGPLFAASPDSSHLPKTPTSSRASQPVPSPPEVYPRASHGPSTIRPPLPPADLAHSSPAPVPQPRPRAGLRLRLRRRARPPSRLNLEAARHAVSILWPQGLSTVGGHGLFSAMTKTESEQTG